MLSAKDRLVFALDVSDREQAVTLLEQLRGKVGMVKVNSLTAVWPYGILAIQNRGFKVWRDWKHHDIPRTVANFIEADIEAGLSMTTVHASGGLEMMQYAVAMKQGAVEAGYATDLKILGVTILTSVDRKRMNEELQIPGPVEEQVKHLALLAQEAGLDGVVASAQEAKVLRGFLNPEMLIVTPGIKPVWAAKPEDQARVVTPLRAMANGADYIVVGSAIHGQPDPAKAADKIVAEIEQGLKTQKETA